MPVDQRISALTALTGAGAAAGDLAVLVDVSDPTFAATGTNKKITLAELVLALDALGLATDAAVAGLASKLAGFTLTYATADKTHADPTSVILTDNSGGTSGGATIAAIGGAVDPTAALLVGTRNAIATLAADVNALRVDLLDLKQLVNSVITDLD